ncbi:NUDIX hydrolase [Legionella dresdenensis]|uniref:NUDIX hydrolase n=1 Tax=Legionella dresdenensis TaxID=450200 RepID=A0ABV8CBH6_9GAMM
MSKDASVIVLHVLESDSILLTERTGHLKDHPGEICFPGGQWQQSDESLYQTALRELHEELGIDCARVILKQQLNTEITLTGFTIYPWLAALETLEPYQINHDEVNELILLPCDQVCNPHNYQKVFVEKNGYRLSSCQFTPHPKFIWGATARIMKQLGDLAYYSQPLRQG